MNHPRKAPQSSELDLNGFEQVFDSTDQPPAHESSLNSALQNEQSSETLVNIIDSEQLVSMPEAAKVMGVPYPTLRRHVLAGKVKSVISKDGKRLVILSSNENSMNEHLQSEKSANASFQNASSNEQSLIIHRLLDQLHFATEQSKQLQADLVYEIRKSTELEARVKLLTEHKPSVWQSVWLWLTGSR